MRHALPRSLSLCALALAASLAGAPTPLRAGEDSKPVVFEGRLNKDDPRDAIRKESGHKVHEVKLEAGKCYQIDLASKDFDTFLRLEDGQKRQLAFNDDIDSQDRNSRFFFAPVQTGSYRLIATAYAAGAAGAYRLQVQPLMPADKAQGDESKLDKEDPVAAGRHRRAREVALEAGQVYVIDLRSKDFDAVLAVLDGQGKQVAFNDDAAPGSTDSRVVLGPVPAGKYRVVATTRKAGERGRYLLRLQAYRVAGSALGPETKIDGPGLMRAIMDGEALTKQGRVPEAVAAYERVLRLTQQAFGPESRFTALAMNNLAVLYQDQRQYGKAEPLLLRSLAIYESKMGKDHPDVANSLNDLAQLYRAQGQYGKAEPLLERSLAIRETKLGKGHPEVATSLNRLALLYEEQGQYAKAEALLLRSLAIRESQLGKDHPDVAISLNNLALVYQALSQYGKAEPLIQRSLEIWESKVGKDHPQLATGLNRLAELYQALGQYGKAEPLFLRSLAIRESKLGKDHPHVATSLNNLGVLYSEQGQYRKAEPLLKRSLAIYDSKLGKDHPDVAVGLNNLAALYRDQGRYDRAEPLYERSLAIREGQLGKDHPSVATGLNSLALLYQDQRQYGKAEPLLQRSLAIYESKMGKDHPDVANSLNNLALLYSARGQYGKVEPLLLRSLAIRERQMGKDHPHVANSLTNLADLYRAQGQYGKAEPLLKRSLAIRESQLGKDHPDVANSLTNLAALYREQWQYGKAEPLYLRSLAIRERKLGKDHPKVASTLIGLSVLYQQQGQYGKAEPLLLRSLGIDESKFGKNHPSVALSLNNLAQLYQAQDKRTQATEATDRARRGLRRYLGRELASLPPRDQLTFLGTHADANLHGALSLAWRLRGQEAVGPLSAAWLINGQALAHETLGEQLLLQRDSAGQPWAPLAAELHEVRRQLAALAVQTAPPPQLAAHRQQLAELAQREEDLARQVAQQSGRGDRAAAWVELEALRKSLPADTVLVALARFTLFNFKAKGKEPRWESARYAAWVIDARDVQIVDLGAAALLEQEVQALGRELNAAHALKTINSEGEPDAEKRLRAALDAVARRVLHPLLPHVKDKPRWLVCPDGALWLVPWTALTLPDGKYVVEQHTLSYLVSGRDVIPTAYKVKATAPVVLADPDFDLPPGKKGSGKPVAAGTTEAITRGATLGAARFGRLPGTAREAKLILPKLQAYAGAAKLCTEAAATEAAFKALKHPKVLVLSTHGFFLPDVERKPDEDFLRLDRPNGRAAKPEENPLLRSGLALAGANQREQASKLGVDDGILTALEILQTDLRGTELVVLSACETGLGEVRNGEGVAGLRQAFQLAGAQSVLATLWQIPDRQTAQLMGKFFDHLAAGRDRAEALRLAQLEAIRARRQREGAAHPFYWAAFTLTGNWR